MSQEAGKQRVLALVSGGTVDAAVVETACLITRRRGGTLYLVAPIVVERALPLDAPLPDAAQRAERALRTAQELAAGEGCQAQTRALRTRDVAMAVVDEAADLGCELIVLGAAGAQRGSSWTVADQVLRQAPCSVWLHRA